MSTDGTRVRPCGLDDKWSLFVVPLKRRAVFWEQMDAAYVAGNLHQHRLPRGMSEAVDTEIAGSRRFVEGLVNGNPSLPVVVLLSPMS
jgi:hypothetical protein